jgi:hypothetical protein
MATQATMTNHGGPREGSGRPKYLHTEPTETVSVVVPKSLLRKVMDKAKQQGISRSQAIVKALRAYY